MDPITQYILIQERRNIQRIRAMGKKIEGYRRKMSKCINTNNPEKCREKYSRKIASLQSKHKLLR